MGYRGLAFDLANEAIFKDSNNGYILALYTNASGQKKTVRLLDIHLPEVDDFGATRIRMRGAHKLMRKSEVPTRPDQGDTLTFNDRVWTINGAEPDQQDLNWELDLEPTR